MTTGFAGFVGNAPIVTIGITEREKYRQMWNHAEYRQVAPGENIAPYFLSIAKPKPGSQVIDFGAGTGRGALMLAIMGQCRVHMLDFTSNCLDEEIHQALTTQAHMLQFTEHNLTKPIPLTAEYGFCTDVMEHIPPQEVDLVLHNILKSAQHVFFQISCEDDVCGKLIGHPLHLSVHNHDWWLKKLQQFDCHVQFSKDFGSHCVFFVSAWPSASELVKVGVLNISEDQAKANVAVNIAGDWTQIHPHVTNDVEVMILGGGPSLNGQLDEIRALKAAGVKIITLNGAYNWAIENGLAPVNQVVVDAREFNARFTKPARDDCSYFIASQCHPSVLEGLPKDRVHLWHTSAESIHDMLNERYESWWGIPGGSTVMLRAIPLFRMLGFKRFHLFGFDSCLAPATDVESSKLDTHHAYSQPENDTEVVIDTIVGGRVFKCHAWMLSQAQEFLDLIKLFGNQIELEVHGDGLIAHILKTGAKLDDEEIAKTGVT